LGHHSIGHVLSPGKGKADSVLVGEKVKNIAQHTGIRFVHFSIFAPGTRHRGKFLVLHIKNLGETAARGPKYIHFTAAVSAFRTGIIQFFHNRLSSDLS
jgi:hypothetical protein